MAEENNTDTIDAELDQFEIETDDADVGAAATLEIQASLKNELSLLQKEREELKAMRSEIKAMRTAENVDQLAAQYGCNDKTLLDDLKGQAAEGKIGESEIQIKILQASLAANSKVAQIQPPSGNGAPNANELIQAAYMINAGWSEEELDKQGHLDEKTINAALAEKFRGFGPHSLAVEYLNSKGHHVLGGKLQHDDIRAAMLFADQDELQAAGGFSTISLPGILSNVARKEVLRGWDSLPSGIEKISKRSTASDYKPYYRYRMDTTGIFEQVGADGELKAISLKEEKFESRVYPFGNKLCMTDVMMKNDDAGAFSDLSRLFGRNARLTVDFQGFTKLSQR